MKISIEELRAKASKFQTRIRWRNLREQAACGLVIVLFASRFFKTPQMVPRISFGLIIAGAMYVAWYLHAWGSAQPLPSDLGRDSCMEFHRRELERQRDLLRDIWKWYIGPFIPGFALFAGWLIVNVPAERRWRPAAFAVGCAAFFWGIGWLNRRAARCLDRQIGELPTPRT